MAHVSGLSKAFALCPTSDYADSIREDVAFFQIVATMFRKYSENGKSKGELDYAVRQLVSKAVVAVRKNVTIDWAVRESAQAKIRVMIRRILRILRKHGYPPDLQAEATKLNRLETVHLMAFRMPRRFDGPFSFAAGLCG